MDSNALRGSLTASYSRISRSQTVSFCSSHPLKPRPVQSILGEQVRLQLAQCSFFLKQVMPSSLQHLDSMQSCPFAVQGAGDRMSQSQTFSDCSSHSLPTHFQLDEQVALQLAQRSFLRKHVCPYS